MIISFNLELNKINSSTNKCSVYIRCTQNRQHRRINTGISLFFDLWDAVQKKVKKKDPNSKELNELLNAKFKSVLTNYAKLVQENDDVTLDELLAEINRDKFHQQFVKNINFIT
jgi:hypothetical protein